MIGFFTIVEFMGDEDAAGFKVQAKVKSQMNENIIGILWLPPHLRRGNPTSMLIPLSGGLWTRFRGLGAP